MRPSSGTPRTASTPTGGILIGAYIWDDDWATRFAARSPAARAAAVAADGEALHPGLAREVSAPVSVAWSRMPRAGGAWAEWTAAQRRDLYPLLRAPEGPYHFAGEYLSWLHRLAGGRGALGLVRAGGDGLEGETPARRPPRSG